MALTFTVTTRTLTFQQGLGALTNEVIWLIVVATFFARAFIKTGFGDRLGLLFVRAFGKTTLSLAYGLQAAEVGALPSTMRTRSCLHSRLRSPAWSTSSSCTHRSEPSLDYE
jgi:DASS family divalent anion:Na+ symporter